MQHLNHPNIPQIYDIEEDEYYIYVITEYIAGESLGALCTHRLLSEKEVFSFIIRICSVIEYLHKLPEKIVHLDIKPENVLVSGAEAMLVDFGSAKMLAKGTATAGSLSLGFTAPEQAKGGPVSCNADIYALGRLLDYMLEHSTVSSHAKKRLDRIVSRCCCNQPWKRISAADILRKMLEELRDAETKHVTKGSVRDGSAIRRIGVLGLSPGAGTTHITLALAYYLADIRYRKVRLIEKSDHNDIGRLSGIINRGLPAGKETVIINGITYYRIVSQDSLSGDNNEFDITVCDLGSNIKKAAAYLNTCDLCIAVAGAALWRAKDYNFLEKPEFASVKERKWLMFVNLADENRMCGIESPGIPMLPFPFETTPLHLHKETAKVIEKAMQ